MKKNIFYIIIVFSSISSVFSNMVLQRNAEINIWGWADKGETVSVIFNNVEKVIVAQEGKWKVSFPEMKAGGPYKMIVKGKNNIEINDIMIGEVWVCSGQSNMEFPFKKAANWESELMQASNNNLRLFQVLKKTSSIPLETLRETEWSICDSTTVKDFSAVAYYFGKFLQKDINVTVGLISTNWGGSNVETWTSTEAINSVKELATTPVKSIPKFDMTGKSKEVIKAKYDAFMKEFGPTKGGLIDGNAIWA